MRIKWRNFKSRCRTSVFNWSTRSVIPLLCRVTVLLRTANSSCCCLINPLPLLQYLLSSGYIAAARKNRRPSYTAGHQRRHTTTELPQQRYQSSLRPDNSVTVHCRISTDPNRCQQLASYHLWSDSPAPTHPKIPLYYTVISVKGPRCDWLRRLGSFTESVSILEALRTEHLDPEVWPVKLSSDCWRHPEIKVHQYLAPLTALRITDDLFTLSGSAS